jgi:hypothetical protein
VVENERAVVQAGDIVRLAKAVGDVPAGSEGVVLKLLDAQAAVLVSFWDQGPLTVPLGALQLVEHPEPWRWADDPRD